MSTVEIIVGDNLESLRRMPDESAQCCVTSPPYWGLRDYGVDGQIGLEPTLDQFISRIVDVFREVRRVLREDGVCWVNMGDGYVQSGGFGRQGETGQRSDRRFTATRDFAAFQNGVRRPPVGLKPKDLIGQPWRLAFALQSSGWWLRQDIIWHKPNPMPESVRDRCTKAHEYVFMLTKSERYYWDAEAMKEPVSGTSNPRVSKVAAAKIQAARDGGIQATHANPDGHGVNPKAAIERFQVASTSTLKQAVCLQVENRNRRSVWSIPSEPYSEAHFATFPTELPRRCILASTRPGDTVLDPFGGSGTTGMVAVELGRSAILCELNPAYAEMARRRCNVTPGLALA